ncbi:hypothetical protein GDO81_024023 [Engystomops pustulosus]|uniref:Uncharacterized protein n=1 Tax=Engystomops pustulosus TaxID=76066 RepID=A0AAV6YJW1_ENGPU|nr:hypothetical protein GDO81_024023 [Engystomops pustulosus]
MLLLAVGHRRIGRIRVGSIYVWMDLHRVYVLMDQMVWRYGQAGDMMDGDWFQHQAVLVPTIKDGGGGGRLRLVACSLFHAFPQATLVHTERVDGGVCGRPFLTGF